MNIELPVTNAKKITVVKSRSTSTETFEEKNPWDVVNEAKERSKIRRFNWKKILGASLTQEILRLKKEGLNVQETYTKLSQNEGISNYTDTFPTDKDKLLENLKISVCARYGENNTAQRIMEEEE